MASPCVDAAQYEEFIESHPHALLEQNTYRARLGYLLARGATPAGMECNLCNINEVGSVQYVANTTGSRTYLFFVETKDKHSIVLKAFSQDAKDPENHNSLYIEAFIYHYFTSVMSQYAPNFVEYYGYCKCPNFIKNIETKLSYYDKGKLEIDRKSFEDVSSMLNVLATKKVTGSSYFDFLNVVQHRSDSDKIIRTTLFQIIFGIEILNRAGLRHSDMHFRNILMDINEPHMEPTCYILNDGSVFSIPSRNRVKLFDYDRAAIPDYTFNPIHTSYCCDYGQCSVENRLGDFFTVLLSLENLSLRSNVKKDVYDFINRIIDPKVKKAVQSEEFPHLLREKTVDMDLLRSGMKTPLEALKDPFFDILRVAPDSCIGKPTAYLPDPIIIRSDIRKMVIADLEKIKI